MKNLIIYFLIQFMLWSCSVSKITENEKQVIIVEHDMKQNYDLVNKIITNQDSLFHYLKNVYEKSLIHDFYENENSRMFIRLKKFLKEYFSEGYEIISDTWYFGETDYHHIEIKSKIKNRKLEFIFMRRINIEWFLAGFN